MKHTHLLIGLFIFIVALLGYTIHDYQKKKFCHQQILDLENDTVYRVDMCIRFRSLGCIASTLTWYNKEYKKLQEEGCVK